MQGNISASRSYPEYNRVKHVQLTGDISFLSNRVLNERDRRLFAGLLANSIGFGGIRKAARLTGLDVKTVRKGKRELIARAHGTIEWFLVYSIRGQNEGIHGILKKRGDIIGDGQHTTWQLGCLTLSKHVSMAQTGLKFMVLVKFMITGQDHHPLRWGHNWKRKKIFFCHVIFIIFSRENPISIHKG